MGKTWKKNDGDYKKIHRAKNSGGKKRYFDKYAAENNDYYDNTEETNEFEQKREKAIFKTSN